MKLLFLGGCERSGTTLLQRVLTAHRRVVGGPEFVFTPHIADLYQRMAGDYPAPWARRIAAYYDDGFLRTAFQDFYLQFFRELGGSNPEAFYLAEKTPTNIRAARSLLDLFPDAQFVHVVRDGRDVLASHRTVRRRLRADPELAFEPAGFGLRAVCRRWNDAVATHFELESDTDLSRRYRAVRYEDLVTDPAATLTHLLAALGLELEPALLAPEAIGERAAQVPADGYWVTEEMLQRPFDTSSIGRWRRDLPLATRLAAGMLLGPNLRRLGYTGS